jgi:hypothetical protein
VTEVDELLEKLDRASDLDDVRPDIARLILYALTDPATPLTPWIKMHLEMAIALLETVWLRLCLMHVRMALETPAESVHLDQERIEHFATVTVTGLVDRLSRAGYPVTEPKSVQRR